MVFESQALTAMSDHQGQKLILAEENLNAAYKKVSTGFAVSPVKAHRSVQINVWQVQSGTYALFTYFGCILSHDRPILCPLKSMGISLISMAQSRSQWQTHLGFCVQLDALTDAMGAFLEAPLNICPQVIN